MTPRPEAAPAAIATQALALRARPSRRQPRHAIQPGNQATSTPTTTDARWGHFKPSRRGQCKPSFSAQSSTRVPMGSQRCRCSRGRSPSGRRSNDSEKGSNCATRFVPTLSVINMLIEDGVLVRADAERGSTRGWADPVEHARMLHDDRRTDDYIAALRQAVRSADIVLDIGTGSGARNRRRPGGRASRVRSRGQRHRRCCRMRVRRQRRAGPGDPDPRLVQRHQAARAGGPTRGGAHRKPTARGGDPRDDARRPPQAAETGRAADPAHPRTGGPSGPCPGCETRQRAIGRHAVHRWRQLYGIEFQPLLAAAFPGPVNNPGSRGPRPLATRGSAGHARHGRARAVSTTLHRRGRRARRHRAGQRLRRDVPCPPARQHRPHARSLEVAVVKLGDVGVGASRRRTGRAARYRARAVQPPRTRPSRRTDLRRFAHFG